MPRTLHLVLVALAVGVGATVSIDLWNLALQRFLGVASLNYRLLGRWIGHMPRGVFRHRSIAAARATAFEHVLGWLAHYAIGVGLALAFTLWLAPGWLMQPTFAPALVYGVGTVVFPFFVMQPSLGLGVASAATPHPMRARVKSVLTHSVYGAGLYASARVAAYVISR